MSSSFTVEERSPGHIPTETGWWYIRRWWRDHGADPGTGMIVPVYVQKFKNGKFRVGERINTDLTGDWYYTTKKDPVTGYFQVKEYQRHYTWFGPVVEIKERV